MTSVHVETVHARSGRNGVVTLGHQGVADGRGGGDGGAAIHGIDADDAGRGGDESVALWRRGRRGGGRGASWSSGGKIAEVTAGRTHPRSDLTFASI